MNSVPSPLLAPEVVAVDVKRSPRSPFRSTADLEPAQAALEGAIELAGARFLSRGEAVDAPQASTEFFETAPIRILEESAPIEGEEWDEPRPARKPRGASMPGGIPLQHPYDAHMDHHRAAEVWRAIAAALIVGGIGGFCLGLIACKWIM